MNISDENIFMPSGCLNWEALKKYQQGGFSDEIRADIDEHILKCSFCHEALEGFKIIPKIDEQDILISSMKKDLEQTIQHKKPDLFQKSKSNQRVRILAAAASILLLAGVFTIYNYLLKPVNEQIADEFITTIVQEENAPVVYSIDRDISSDGQAPITQNKPIVAQQVEMEAEEDYSNSNESLPPPRNESKVSQSIVETKISSSVAEGLVVDTGLSKADLVLPANEPIYYEELAEEVATQSFEASKKQNKILLRGVSASRSAPEMKSGDTMNVGGINTTIPPRFESERYTNFDDYISSNINYPSNAKNDGIEGVVIVEFTISINGKTKDPKIIKGAETELDAEAIRLIKKSPEWIPANLNGVEEEHKIQWTIQFKMGRSK